VAPNGVDLIWKLISVYLCVTKRAATLRTAVGDRCHMVLFESVNVL